MSAPIYRGGPPFISSYLRFGTGTKVFDKAATVSSSPSVLTNVLKVATTITASITATSGLNSIRGEMRLNSGMTLSGTSFVAGVYGRGNIFGTVAVGSGSVAAVYGKLDLNGSTLTSGYIAPVQSNIVNPPSDSSKVNGYYGESAGGNVMNAHIKLFGKATAVLDIDTNVHDPEAKATGTLTSASGYITVLVNGSTRYIPLYTTIA